MSSKPVYDILKMVEHTRFHPGCGLFTWHPQGELDDDLADQIVRVVESDEFFHHKPFNRYADFSALTRIRLHFGHVFKIAEHRRAVLQPVKSAFFAETTVGFGIARMYESLMEGGTIIVRAFREREAAAEWLEVPLEILLPE